MARSAGMIFGIFCVATLLSECVAVGILWSRGQLTSQTLKEFRVILTGEDEGDVGIEEEDQNVQPSAEDVKNERSTRIFGLATREVELSVLKRMINENKDLLTAQKDEFEVKKAKFDEELALLNKTLVSEATEQTRGILLALKSADAVENLMQLELAENVVLLKGMPEDSIAKILQEFLNGVDAQQIKRGQEIFEAISKGEPQIKMIEKTKDKLTQANSPKSN